MSGRLSDTSKIGKNSGFGQPRVSKIGDRPRICGGTLSDKRPNLVGQEVGPVVNVQRETKIRRRNVGDRNHGRGRNERLAVVADRLIVVAHLGPDRVQAIVQVAVRDS